MWTKVQKSKLANSSRRALEGRACTGRLPELAEWCLGDSLTLGSLPSATQGVFTVVNGTAKFFQHDFQRGVLGKLDHEHARLHADVA